MHLTPGAGSWGGLEGGTLQRLDPFPRPRKVSLQRGDAGGGEVGAGFFSFPIFPPFVLYAVHQVRAWSAESTGNRSGRWWGNDA